jgi:hypothetical protein
MSFRLRARSAVSGQHNFKAGRLAFLPAASSVWNGVGVGDGTTGTKRASSITNLSAANVKKDVVVDDVTGIYGGGGTTLPPIIVDSDTGEPFLVLNDKFISRIDGGIFL